MASRGERRPAERRDDDYPPRKNGFGPGKEPIRETARAPPRPLNEYFIDGDGISREVLQYDICKHLGPEATCRPAQYHGKSGFLIKALRPFTPAQLDDLKLASEQYDYDRRRARDERREEPSYDYTASRRDQSRYGTGPGSEPQTDYYAGANYPSGANNPYSPPTTGGYPSTSFTSVAPGYPAAYSMATGAGPIPATSAYGPVTGQYDPNYTYAPQGNAGYPAEYQSYPSGYDNSHTQPPRTSYRTQPYDASGRPLAPQDDRSMYYPNESSYQNPQSSYQGSAYPRPPVPPYENPGRDPYSRPTQDPNAAYRRGR